MSHNLILASASMQRRQLLRQIGIEADVIPVDIDETPLADEAGLALVSRLAREKASAALSRLAPGQWVMGADTIIMLKERIYGKPVDASHAHDMLMSLSGQTHRVVSAVCLRNRLQTFETQVTSHVQFCQFSEAQATRYWHSGEPEGKAGAYGIQGKGAVFVERLEGSYSNVVGLPLYETAVLLEQAGMVIK